MVENKLINADDLLSTLRDDKSINGSNLRRVIQHINAAPAVDAVVLPCKVGDPVWFVGTSNINRLKLGVIEATVEKLVLKSSGIYMKLSCNAMYETSCRSIGKSVFFRKEEAESALAKMDGGNEDA